MQRRRLTWRGLSTESLLLPQVGCLYLGMILYSSTSPCLLLPLLAYPLSTHTHVKSFTLSINHISANKDSNISNTRQAHKCIHKHMLKHEANMGRILDGACSTCFCLGGGRSGQSSESGAGQGRTEGQEKKKEEEEEGGILSKIKKMFS